MSLLLVVVVVAFKHILDTNVIDGLLQVATYTYGPLLGLFTFGIFTKHQLKDQYVWIVAVIVVLIIYLIASIPSSAIGGYQIGYELLPINGLLTFIGLWFIRKKDPIV